ncbi:MAG: hypothetical protein AB7U82_00665 [Blastocatellales bacterium]
MTAESNVKEGLEEGLQEGLKESGLKASLSDRINPIVIKELRQAVQSRFVIAALMTLLSIQIVAIGIYLLASGGSLLSFDAGRQVFLMLFAILQVVGMLFVPLYTAVRMAAERSDTNVDLLFITTIKPRSVIAGKMLAAVMLTVLIYSACMPFMAFTYFLRGIDLPSIFLSLAFGFAVVIACAQAAVFVALIPVNRAFKVIFGLIALIIFGIAYFATMASVSSVITRGIVTRLSWEPAIILGVVIAFLIGLFFVMSVALIMPIASNRALPVRLFLTAAWLLMGVAALTNSLIEKQSPLVVIWLIIFEIVFALAIFVAVSERDQPGRRVLRSVPQSPGGRALSFFFFSGAASGLAWATVMIALTLGVAWAWVELFPSHNSVGNLLNSAKWTGGMCLYFFCYALTGALLRRNLLNNLGTELTWLVGAILLGVGSIAPFLIGYIVFFNDQWWSDDLGAWFVGNPFAWGNKGHRVLYASVAGVWAALVAAMNLPWFLERVKSFEPPPRAVTSESPSATD